MAYFEYSAHGGRVVKVERGSSLLLQCSGHQEVPAINVLSLPGQTKLPGQAQITGQDRRMSYHSYVSGMLPYQ